MSISLSVRSIGNTPSVDRSVVRHFCSPKRLSLGRVRSKAPALHISPPASARLHRVE